MSIVFSHTKNHSIAVFLKTQKRRQASVPIKKIYGSQSRGLNQLPLGLENSGLDYIAAFHATGCL